jgi:hypothetical protein
MQIGWQEPHGRTPSTVVLISRQEGASVLRNSPEVQIQMDWVAAYPPAQSEGSGLCRDFWCERCRDSAEIELCLSRRSHPPETPVVRRLFGE